MRGEEGDDGVGGIWGEVAEAAFGDEESRDVWVDVREG